MGGLGGGGRKGGGGGEGVLFKWWLKAEICIGICLIIA